MNNCKKFNVGNIVKIRSWEDMAEEFGTNSPGTINTRDGFLREMKPLCGKYAKIVRLDKNGEVKLKFFNCKGLEDLTEFYSFDIDMIEKA